jgi:hypothetical protein
MERAGGGDHRDGDGTVTEEEAVSLVESISFGRLPWVRMTRATWDAGFAAVVIDFAMNVPDRDTGAPIVTHQACILDVMSFKHFSKKDIVEYIRRSVIDFLVHELDEHLAVDGVRWRDPHIVIGARVRFVNGCTEGSGTIVAIDGKRQMATLENSAGRFEVELCRVRT